MAAADADGFREAYEALRLRVAARVKEMLALLTAEQKKCGDTCPLTVANPKSAQWSPPDKLPVAPAGKPPRVNGLQLVPPASATTLFVPFTR